VREVKAEDKAQGRVRYTVSAESARDLRPEIFRLAAQKGWVLYELHQEAGSVEDLFRQLTGQPDAAPAEVTQ
jgi:hypothetical protein